jgi:hypothetical protein
VAEDKKEYVKRFYLCVGDSFTLQSGKIGRGFISLTEEQVKEVPNVAEFKRSYFPEFLKHSFVGNVYAVMETEDGAFVQTGSGDYVGRWEDKALVAQWETEQRLRRAELQLKKEEKAAKSEEALAELLAPVKQVYRKLPRPARNQMLARIVQLLERN